MHHPIALRLDASNSCALRRFGKPPPLSGAESVAAQERHRLERLPVTQEVAGASLVAPAKFRKSYDYFWQGIGFG